MLVLEQVLLVVEEFEQASGSITNKDKSAIVPSRHLSTHEQMDCRRRWHELRISYCERLLGLYIGIDATIDDQYRAPLQKFDDALATFTLQKHNMSLAVRVMVVNVFLWSLFSFQNRYFLMPRTLLQEVQHQALRFLTPVTWSCLGLFAHLHSLYSIRVQLTDLRLSNVAHVLSSYGAHYESIQHVSDSLRQVTQMLQSGSSPRPDPIHPADICVRAREFYSEVTGGSIPESTNNFVHTTESASAPAPQFRALYQSMLEKEEQYWDGYLRLRISMRG